ncbi:outer membrane receptor for transport of vitamin B, putative [Polaribacter irgensii 23-P]|uniref:Outer membrane receptor for transport of vitamin B, putative n=1 Tax=Polaribacter irgensii 23-P TaxID=313594 RepID=A4BXM3_9FLAO|nr:TonB-dependent receptor [Polaribacter irgensii]EAR13714.1 outer membrane receptor for transport of vitamin B, putative [Polaribacter irgensii 23-P]
MFLNRIAALLFSVTTFTCFSQNTAVIKDTLTLHTLDEIVVTATRTMRQLSTVPMPVILISKKQIQNTGTTRLKEILLEQTGINFATDQSGFTGVQMQGLSSEYVMVMIDGVPVIGRSSGNLDLNRITVNNIKQIEVVKGPTSSLYGSEALGGVINIITEHLEKDTSKGDIRYFTRVGSRNELDLNTNFLFRKDKLSLVAGINLNSSGGFDLSPETVVKTTEAYQNYTGNLKVSYDFSKKLTLVASQRYFYEEQAERNFQRDWNSNIELRHKMNNIWDFEYTFYTTKFKTESQFNSEVAVFNQTLTRPEIRATANFKNSTVISGIGINFDALGRTFFGKKETFNSKYIFSQFDFHPIERMNVVVGARFDSHNKYKSAFSPKIASTYKINDWIQAKASVGYGFKAPDFRQLFFNFNNAAGGYVVLGTQTLHNLYGSAPNVQATSKDLKPENAIGYNFGLEIKPIANLKIHTNIFRNDIKDLINTVALPGGVADLGPTTAVFYYENRDQVFTQGIEFDINYKFSENVRFTGGYQYLEAKDKEDIRKIEAGTIFLRRTPNSPSEILKKEAYFGLSNRSKHTANAKLFYTNLKHNFSANIRAIYRSKYALFDTNNSQNIIDRYDDFVAGNTQVNVSIQKTFFGIMNLQFGIDNIGNEKGLKNKNKFQNTDAVLFLGRSFYTSVRFNL